MCWQAVYPSKYQITFDKWMPKLNLQLSFQIYYLEGKAWNAQIFSARTYYGTFFAGSPYSIAVIFNKL